MARAMRLVVAVLGLRSEDRAEQEMVGALRDSGAEVVYAGTGMTATSVVAAIVQEDADALGLVIADDGQHAEVVDLLRLLREECDDRVQVVIKGGLSPTLRADLHARGVRMVLGPGDPPEAVLEIVKPGTQRGE